MYENKQKRPKFHFFFAKNGNKNDSPLGFVLLFIASFRLESFGSNFFLKRQHSYFGVMHCENSEFQIAFFWKLIMLQDWKLVQRFIFCLSSILTL